MRVRNKSFPILLSLQVKAYQTKRRGRNTNEPSLTSYAAVFLMEKTTCAAEQAPCSSFGSSLKSNPSSLLMRKMRASSELAQSARQEQEF